MNEERPRRIDGSEEYVRHFRKQCRLAQELAAKVAAESPRWLRTSSSTSCPPERGLVAGKATDAIYHST